MDLTSVLDVARDLTSRGFFVIPLVHASKATYDRNWQHSRHKLDAVDAVFHPDRDPGIGLLLGASTLEGNCPIGIDVDVEDPVLLRRVRLAIPGHPPAKRGKKGITYIARTSAPVKGSRVNRKDALGKTQAVADILARDLQIAIPPSIHPDTKNPYEWVADPVTGRILTLHDFTPDTLPLIDEYVLEEIKLAAQKPESSLFLINDMENSTDSTPGTAHNSVLSAVAVMVSLKWPDDAIWRRIEWATEVTGYEAPRDWEIQVRQMAEDARTKGWEGQAAQKVKNDYVGAATWVIDQWRGPDSVRNLSGRVAAYADGFWDMIPDEDIRHVVARQCPVRMDGHRHWDETCCTVLDLAERVPRNRDEHSLVCLRNGTIDLESGGLREWRREDYLTTGLPFSYDPDAECPRYEQFLREVFAGDDVERRIALYEEFAGYSMVRSHKYHKFLVLKGLPGSGKSVLLNLMKEMHDPARVSSVQAEHFGDEKYSAHMVGKPLNVTSEIAAMSNVADGFLKTVTAGDSTTVRPLYANPSSTVLPTRFIIACNEMFRIRDTSGAVERRMMIIPCDNAIPEQRQDVNLISKLRAELPGIFNRVARAYRILEERGRFDIPPSSRAAVASFSEENNHVLQWYQERTHQGKLTVFPEHPAPGTLPPSETNTLYADYTDWSKFHGFQQMTSNTFLQKLTTAAPGSQSRTIRLGRDFVRVRPITLISRTGF